MKMRYTVVVILNTVANLVNYVDQRLLGYHVTVDHETIQHQLRKLQ